MWLGEMEYKLTCNMLHTVEKAQSLGGIPNTTERRMENRLLWQRLLGDNGF